MACFLLIFSLYLERAGVPQLRGGNICCLPEINFGLGDNIEDRVGKDCVE